jgi:hypothetical protein
LMQLVGSDAGDWWFRGQSLGAGSNRFNGLPRDSHLSTDSHLKSPRPKPCVSSHRPAETDSSKTECKLLNQEIPNSTSMSMDEDLPYHLGSDMLLQPYQDGVNDIGLLFTDAAHTVLTRLGGRTSQ